MPYNSNFHVIVIIQQKIPNCNALLRKSSCFFAQGGATADSPKKNSRKERKEMEGGNGASAVNEVTLCSNHAYQNDATENHTGSRTKSAAARRRSQSALPRVCQYPLPLVALPIQPLKKISRSSSRSSQSYQLAFACGGSLQKSLNVEIPSNPLVRGHPVRNRNFL